MIPAISATVVKGLSRKGSLQKANENTPQRLDDRTYVALRRRSDAGLRPQHAMVGACHPGLAGLLCQRRCAFACSALLGPPTVAEINAHVPSSACPGLLISVFNLRFELPWPRQNAQLVGEPFRKLAEVAQVVGLFPDFQAKGGV
jgi:hypothetical protein